VRSRITTAIIVGVALLSIPALTWSEDAQPIRKVLIVVEGKTDLKNYAMGDGRQLATLLGHFQATATVHGLDRYTSGEIDSYDVTFYIGFHADNLVPAVFMDDVLKSSRPLVWLNTGFKEFSAARNVRQRFGFAVSRLDSTSVFDGVRFNGRVFKKGEQNINTVELVKGSGAKVLATAYSAKTKRELPYLVQSDNLLYFADSPFSGAGEADRYLLFADMLHDILHQTHPESHSALIRIEDVTPLENPNALRDIADILSGRGIPFLVGVVPFYVDPGEGIHVSLSEKPELVDALKYMVQSGGTIVMHGVTHQYKGVTASDYEFWDDNANGPIREQTPEQIERKLDMGIQEFMKNGLYPVIWETPHYTASLMMYKVVAKYFSSAMEQRLSLEDFDYSQFFPYIIEKDLFGQKIYPENLGYIPLESEKSAGEEHVRALIENARANLAVRDGFASCFFHAFLDLDLLKQLVDGVRDLGYTYVDLKDQKNWVKANDRVILTGSQEYSIALNDQYLLESRFDRDGEVMSRTSSEKRLSGVITKNVELEPGEMYKAEPAEFHEKQPSFTERVLRDAKSMYTSLVTEESQWQEARPVILWNHYARGSAYNDQASFAAVFRSVNINVDTLFIGEPLDLSHHNLLVVPYPFVDSLKQADYETIDRFVEGGGNVITDSKNYLAQDFGVTFSTTFLKVSRVRDQLFPEERISWRYSELVPRFEVDEADEIFCYDDVSDAPLVVGKKVGKGKLIYFGSRFDPHTQDGYSHYPYLMEYVGRYFKLGPVVRRENLEMYFEPGDRRNVSAEHLVHQWVSQGIRIVHVSGWHQYPRYEYDYKRLIRLAHANGILVFAWLEPPQVSQKFWADHPQWREKNYKGDDVRPSWRYPVALTDSACVDTMISFYRQFLDRFDWDGVNLAELYFEAGRGFDDPQFYTPMHSSAIREVKRRFGFDLRNIFDPHSQHYWKTNSATRQAVTEYRVEVIGRVMERLLEAFGEVARKKDGFQILVTAMDSYGSPELREHIAVDMSHIVAYQKKYGFHLQVEDPESKWSMDPGRYVDIGDQYSTILGGKEKLLLDLNILAFRKPDAVTPFPTLTQTGTESFQMVKAASLGAPRLTIYSEASVNAQDLRYFPYAQASEVQYEWSGDECTVSSPYSFMLRLPADVRSVSVDDVPLSPVRENEYLIPAGNRIVKINTEQGASFSPYTLQTQLLSSTANILSITYDVRSVLFDYRSDMRALVSLNREPTNVRIDGHDIPVTVLKGNDCFTIILPSGKHSAEIIGGDRFSYGVSLTSLWSSTAIALFGSGAVLLLVVMYLFMRAVRMRAARGERMGA
jgi:uncharacterized protein YdaL